MKLRIKGNSLRLRLTKTEVGKFAEEGRLEDSISFGKSRLSYSLEAAAVEGLTASLQGNQIKVKVPQEMGRKWTSSEEVGMEGSQPIEGEESLRILVEKDFACLTPRKDEDESDAYPNPNSHC